LIRKREKGRQERKAIKLGGKDLNTKRHNEKQKE